MSRKMAIVLALMMLPEIAGAYSIRIHIMYANRIRDALIEQHEATGLYRVGLLGPGVDVGDRPCIGDGGTIGDACGCDADCAFEADGALGYCHASGFCTVPCEGLCPEPSGAAPNFCADVGGGEGACVLKATPDNKACDDVGSTRLASAERHVGGSGAPQRTVDVCMPTATGEQRFVHLQEADALAIMRHPTYFRGGAIGPDATVFTGLTDASHSPAFSPFSQTNTLYEAARYAQANATTAAERTQAEQERAFALGTFLHGVTDNVVHHLVNYFSGQTFTFFPVECSADAEARGDCEPMADALEEGWGNVARHIVFEGEVQKGFEDTLPHEFTDDKMKVDLAADLWRRVYWEQASETYPFGIWHYFVGDLVSAKEDYLAANAPADFDSSTEMTIERAKHFVQVYIDFLRGQSDRQIESFEYTFLVPEMIRDVKRLLLLRGQTGRFLAEETNGFLHPIDKKYYGWMFVDLHPDQVKFPGMTRYEAILKAKFAQLDNILVARLQTKENVMNLLVTTEPAAMTPAMLRHALSPLTRAIDDFISLDEEELALGIVGNLLSLFVDLTALFDKLTELITAAIKEKVQAKLREVIDHAIEEVRAYEPQAIRDVRARVDEIKAEIAERLGEEKIRLVGLDLTDANGILKDMSRSVLYMNSWNTIAGTLSNTNLAFPVGKPGFFAGPVSFDASFQVEYNQMALCGDLRPYFYPCGTSAGEMLQVDYRTCETFSEKIDPPIECRRQDRLRFETDPTREDCRRTTLDALMGPLRSGESTYGSDTLAFPPHLSSDGGVCFGFEVVGINAPGPTPDGDGNGDRKGDGVEGGGADEDEGGDGCSTSGAPASPPYALFLLLAGVSRGRRRG